MGAGAESDPGPDGRAGAAGQDDGGGADRERERSADSGPGPGRTPAAEEELAELADRLHSAAIHLLRRVRRVDPEVGVTAARLSALSVVVRAGPLRVSELAEAEQVRPPTTSRMVDAMEEEGLVTRRPSPSDGRVVLVEATERGRRVLEEARERRVGELADELGALSGEDREVLRRAADALEGWVGGAHAEAEPPRA